ncbi:MAG TPA: hypothetical protein VF791_15475 [Pyrinomonadaceae bacterium]
MTESAPGSPATESARQRLRDLRRGLLRLHKILLDLERAWYEQAHGRVSSGELLRLAINHEQFAWLHSISELIVRIDEMLDADEPLTIGDAESLVAHARSLLRPSDTGSEFERKYFAAIQSEPDVVFAHREMMRLLSSSA